MSQRAFLATLGLNQSTILAVDVSENVIAATVESMKMNQVFTVLATISLFLCVQNTPNITMNMKFF